VTPRDSSAEMTRKWYKIELYLQLQNDRKSYMVYKILPFSQNLNDRNAYFKGMHLC